jgi:beta-fructofuranosidase
MLRVADQWVWDSWVVDDGENYHLFFLQAPRSLGSPERRHTAARIGHATSTDLVERQYHGVALAPSANGWDDLALWTGSVVRADDGTWLVPDPGVRGRGACGPRARPGSQRDLARPLRLPRPVR